MNQGRTKEEPKNTETQKSTFIKIAFSFPSLIPSLLPPTDDRETTERTPKEDHMTKKALFLRLSPKKVDLILEKVALHPEKIDLRLYTPRPLYPLASGTPDNVRLQRYGVLDESYSGDPIL